MPINLDQAPQQVGSQLTYLKRYQAAAYFGIAADDDDDGNATAGNQAEFKDREPRGGARAPAAKAQPAKPAAKPPVKPDPHGPDDVQKHPDDDAKPPEPDPRKSKDPADYIIPFGNETKGKMIRELSEAQLKKIRDWTAAEMKKVPPPPNVADLLATNVNVRGFLKSVGVE